MTDDRIVWLVVNGASGSNDEEAVARVREALAAGGATPARVVDIQDDPCPDVAMLREAGVGLVAVFGGDGTINGLIGGLDGWDGSALALPGGTANLLARELHGERSAEEIAASVATLHPVRRQSITCSQGRALIEVLAGPGATWSDVREGIREGDIVEVATTGAEAVRQSVAGPVVHLREPLIGRESGYTGIRLVPDSARMVVTGYGAETFGDYLLQGMALLKRDYREGPHEELGQHGEVRCGSSDGEAIELMIDGERRTGGSEERFSLAELAVDLLATRR